MYFSPGQVMAEVKRKQEKKWAGYPCLILVGDKKNVARAALTARITLDSIDNPASRTAPSEDRTVHCGARRSAPQRSHHRTRPLQARVGLSRPISASHFFFLIITGVQPIEEEKTDDGRSQ